MPASFDPYHKWLGIPPEDQPPNLYRLLGIRRFENDPDVIEAAADQRTIHLPGWHSHKRFLCPFSRLLLLCNPDTFSEIA